MVLPLFEVLPEFFFKALRLVLALRSHCCGCGDHKGSALLKSVRRSQSINFTRLASKFT